jgi:VWFA-related protein
MTIPSRRLSNLPAYLRRGAILAVLLLLGGGIIGSAARAYPSSLPTYRQDDGASQDTLRLSAAPVTLVFPSSQAQWGRRLGGYADLAASSYATFLGVPAPTGRIEWRPDDSAADTTRGSVEISHDGATTIVSFDDPFAILANDQGVSSAVGYGRWLVSYALARLYFASQEDPNVWWAEGAALYLTDLLSREARSTTPVLYALESAYARTARRQQGIPMSGEGGAEMADAARSKAYLTFRLMEALYGTTEVTSAISRLAQQAPSGDSPEVVAAAFSSGLQPDPLITLQSWMQPTATIDLGLDRVRLEDGGSRLTGRLTRRADIDIPVRLEIHLIGGEVIPLDLVANAAEVSWEIEVPTEPVDVRLDPDARLPDINRANNRHGFGSAERVRDFFPLDRQAVIGELHFSEQIETIGMRRVEEFSVTLTNLTDEPLGLGLLVSAQWLDRPAARRQRAVFFTIPAGEQRRVRDFLIFPRLGRGRARIEARYWRASDPAGLTQRVLRDPPDVMNSYMVIRDPEVGVAPDNPFDVVDEPLVSPVAELTVVERTAPEQELTGEGAGEGAQPAEGAAEISVPDNEELWVRITSPEENVVPVGELTFEASVGVGGQEVSEVELYVNDRLIFTGSEPPFRTTWLPDENQDIFVLRAVAVDSAGRITTDTRVLNFGFGIGFGASVDLVTLHPTVRELSGTYLRGLTADDFQILEDDRPQEITEFVYGETPVSVALLLDTSSSMIGGGIRSEQAGATRLVNSLLRGRDRAMILGFNDRLYLYADFSEDIPALERAISITIPDGSTALYDAVVEALRKVNTRRGKRALVVLSDGLDTQSDFSYADVLEYARQSNVLIYTIGLQLMHDATELGDASGAVRDSVENLRALAETTGGAAYFPLRLDELEDVYTQIADELTSQYAISYYPSNQQWDGRWRRVEISLPNYPNVRIQARPGYYGVRPDRRQ